MINKQLDELFIHWKAAMEDNGDIGFCSDGLIYRNGDETALWNSSSRKILYLLKECNNGDGDDVREWTGSINGYSPNRMFFNRISAWLYGLTNYSESGYPPIEEAFNTKNQMKALLTYPYAYVNVKKKSGGATADDNLVYKFAECYTTFLRKELDILSPNIIVCGGQVVFEIACELIYPELHFVEKNSWVFYNIEKNIILINSFHPTARKTNEVMYEFLMKSLIQYK